MLNAHFVPVYAVNEDYRRDGSQPADERKEFTRIYREAPGAKMSAGTVHVYITAPDGKTVDSMHVAEAAKTDKLLATLKRNIERFDLAAGKTLVKLSGNLKMKHTFYHKADSNVAGASVVGYAEVDTSKAKIRAFGLTTGKATYGGGKFVLGVQIEN